MYYPTTIPLTPTTLLPTTLPYYPHYSTIPYPHYHPPYPHCPLPPLPPPLSLTPTTTPTIPYPHCPLPPLPPPLSLTPTTTLPPLCGSAAGRGSWVEGYYPTMYIPASAIYRFSHNLAKCAINDDGRNHITV